MTKPAAHIHSQVAIKSRVRVIKAHARPEFTDNDFWRNEISYLKVLMRKHKPHALRIAQELLLTDEQARV